MMTISLYFVKMTLKSTGGNVSQVLPPPVGQFVMGRVYDKADNPKKEQSGSRSE